MPKTTPNKTDYRLGADGHVEFYKRVPPEDKSAKSQLNPSDVSILAMKYILNNPNSITRKNDQRKTAFGIAAPIVKAYPQINIMLIDEAHKKLMGIDGYKEICEKVAKEVNAINKHKLK